MAESMFNSLIQNRLSLRDSNPELFAAMEAGFPLVSSHPNAAATAQGMATPGQVQQTAQNVAGSGQQPAAQEPQQQQQQPPNPLAAVMSKLFEAFNEQNAKDKKATGPDLFGQGGLLGTGISTSTALMHAIGAAITSRMPQQQALEMTMKIGGMPKDYELQKSKILENQIGTIMQGINAQTAQGNLAQRQQELQAHQQTAQRKEDFFKSIDTTSGILSAQDKVKGVIAGVLPASMLNTDVDYVDAVDAEGKPIKSIRNKQTGAQMMDAQGNPMVIPQAPKGSASGRAIQTGELADALATGKNTEKLLASGFDVTTPQGRSTVENAVARRRAMESQRIGIAQTNSDRAQVSQEMVRPDERKELTGLREIHVGASDMLKKYDAALASHKGVFPTGVQIALDAATTSPDTFIGKTAQAIGQRYPGLTSADLQFISRFATMQKFARGSLNDVGNLSNFERGIFQTMIGTPLDRPELFRARAQTVIGDAERNYGVLSGVLGTTRNISEFPKLTPSKQEQPNRNNNNTMPPPPAGWSR